MDPAAERHRVRDLLQQSDVAMLLTFGSGEAHAGRPMLPLWLPEDPNIYFLTHRESRKVAQVNERLHVALTVINAGCYLVVLGLAYASQDPALIRRLWRPSYRAWFPKGSDDREADGASDSHQQSELLGAAEEPRSPVVPSGHSRRH